MVGGERDNVITLLVLTCLGSVFFSGVSWLLPPGGGFSICKTPQRTWLRILSIALEKELSPWLDFMAKFFFFYLVCFPFFPPAFSHFSDEVFPLIKVFLYRQKVSRGLGGISILGRPQRVLLSYRSSGHTLFLIKSVWSWVWRPLRCTLPSASVKHPELLACMSSCPWWVWAVSLYERRLNAEELMLLNWGMEKTLESPLDSQETKPVNPKGNQHWIFIGRTNAEAPILFGHLMQRANSLEKNPNAGKDWGQEEKGATEDEMLGWHHDSVDVNLSKLWKIKWRTE